MTQYDKNRVKTIRWLICFCFCSPKSWGKTTAARPHHTSIEIFSLAVIFRFDINGLLFAFKALNGLEPSYFPIHASCLCFRQDIKFIQSTAFRGLKTRSDQDFGVAAPKLWSSFPPQSDVFPLQDYSDHYWRNIFFSLLCIRVESFVSKWYFIMYSIMYFLCLFFCYVTQFGLNLLCT